MLPSGIRLHVRWAEHTLVETPAWAGMGGRQCRLARPPSASALGQAAAVPSDLGEWRGATGSDPSSVAWACHPLGSTLG